MDINRIVPDLHSLRLEESKGFYADFLGLSLQMDMGWVLTFVSTSNRTAQITILKATDYGIPLPHLSIEVEDVVKLQTEALSRGLEIVYPLVRYSLSDALSLLPVNRCRLKVGSLANRRRMKIRPVPGTHGLPIERGERHIVDPGEV
jgi:glyoxalase/bleomycin resistance protein/dioxygenase superfamily protein